MAFLTLILWPFVQALGSDSWHTREWSQRALAAAWPASEAALVRGQHHDDPETRERCRLALEQVRRCQSQGKRAFTVLAVPTELEAYCLGLVVRDHESEGLPWSARWMHEHWDNIAVRRELQRLNEMYGLVDGMVPERSVLIWTDYSDFIPGLDDLRFAYRGLPGPSQWNYYGSGVSRDDAIRLWAIKKVWRAPR